MEIGYFMVVHIRLGAKIGDLHAKDSNSFCKRLIASFRAHQSSYICFRKDRAVVSIRPHAVAKPLANTSARTVL